MKDTKNKKVYGVGINDAGYVVQPTIDGKQVACPFYGTWKKMLGRCYCKKQLSEYPTYIGCSVATEWHSYIAFRNWMYEQQWRGKELDKDIIKLNNKVYGPDTCMFVTHRINSLLTDRKSARGPWPLGVSYHKSDATYHAAVSIKGKNKNVGCYSTPEEAHAAYCLAKADYIESLFPELKGEDPRLIPALQRHANNFRQKSREQAAHSNQNQN